jgi:hypothetical protein
MKKIKTIKENIILDNDYFKVQNDDVLFPNNKEGKYLKVTPKPVNKGIAVLAMTSDFNVIIQDEYRYAMQKDMTEVVKGGVEENESFEDAAKRELSEELNLSYGELIDLGSYTEHPGMMFQYNRAFLALDCKKENIKIVNDGTEAFSNKRNIAFKDLLEICLNNGLDCSVTQMVILKASYAINKIR